jgi:hypothetical protein
MPYQALSSFIFLSLSLNASAQTVVVDVQDGLVFGSSRIRSMGGAFTGVAEGSAGQLFNPATIAIRSAQTAPRDPAIGFDFGFAQSMLRYTFPTLLPNAQESPPVDLPAYTGFASTQYQSGRHGVGVTMQTQGYTFEKAPGESALVNHHQVAAGYAVSLLEEGLVIGAQAKLHMGTVTQEHFLAKEASQRAYFPGAQIGIALNPTDSLRLGWTLAAPTGTELVAQQDSEPLSISIHQPLLTTLGISYRWEHDVEVNGRYRDGRFLLLASDLVYFGAKGESFSATHLAQGSSLSSGATPSLALRVGVDSEIVPGWLRLRGGLYTEPARFVVETSRLHVTAGGQLRVFNFPKNLRWGLVTMLDLATDYSDSSVGIGFW